MIRSDRNVYIAAHVKPEVREALKVESKKQLMSVSELISETLEQMLKDRGHVMKRPVDLSREPQLPFYHEE